MIIENSKTYKAKEVENIFFRPTFCGPSAKDLGVRVVYNMPIPTTVPLLTQCVEVLNSYSSGWQGGSAANITPCKIDMKKIKAEAAYSADDYFSTVYELMLSSAEANIEDLTGTELEKAETELFRRSIADGIFATMWFGCEDEELSLYTTFNGFIRQLIDLGVEYREGVAIKFVQENVEINATDILHETWVDAPEAVRSLAADGQLAYFVSSDIYDAYYFELENNGALASTMAEGASSRPTLTYHGIPLVEIPVKRYSPSRANTFCLLTDRRNLVLALNTADAPENEVRMWYNPDEMENRQRVTFMAGAKILDHTLLSAKIYDGEVSL